MNPTRDAFVHKQLVCHAGGLSKRYRYSMKFTVLAVLFLCFTSAKANLYECEFEDSLFLVFTEEKCDDGVEIKYIVESEASIGTKLAMNRALIFFSEHLFQGKAFIVNEWYSQETIDSGAIHSLESSTAAYVKKQKEYSDKEQGFKKLEFSLKGQSSSLISLDTFVFFNSGKIKKLNHCWKNEENQIWKMHNSCLELLFQQEKLSEDEKQQMMELEKLIQGRQ